MQKPSEQEMKTIGTQRIAAIVDDALQKANKFNEAEIYTQIGTALTAMGLEAEDYFNTPYYLKPSGKLNFKDAPIDSAKKFLDKVSEKIDDRSAEQQGKGFWDVFRVKAYGVICKDQELIKLIKESKLKEAIEAALPSILILLGMTSLWIPVVACLVSGLVMMLLKVGIESFCACTEEK